MSLWFTLLEATPWQASAVTWATTNIVVAQSAAPDDLLGVGLTVAGVTIPFAVGWAWNRQWADAVRRQNDFLKDEVSTLRVELSQERGEKLSSYEENDHLRVKIGEIQNDLSEQKQRRHELELRVSHLEQVILRMGGQV